MYNVLNNKLRTMLLDAYKRAYEKAAAEVIFGSGTTRDDIGLGKVIKDAIASGELHDQPTTTRQRSVHRRTLRR